jgi:hypothetical protein
MKRTLMLCVVLLGLGLIGGAHAKGEGTGGTYEIHEYSNPKKAHFTLTDTQAVVGFTCSGNGTNAAVECYVLTVSH